MHYENIKDSSPSDFKRLTGVRKETFELMVRTLREHLRDFGRPPKNTLEDRLLMTLMYWREYRTQFHIAQSYGVKECTVSRTVRKVEDALIRSKLFHLPGKKALRPNKPSEAPLDLQFILVDAAECPVERPKQTENSPPATAARRSVTRSKRR
jgi:hypothetical protein